MKREFTSISRLCYHSYLAENLSCTKLRSGSTVIFLGKLIPAQQGESKSLPFSSIPEYLNYVCLRIDRNNVVASLVCAFTWLPWHQTDLKLNTRPSQPHTMHIRSVHHGHSKNVDRIGKNLAIQLKECRWPRIGFGVLLSPVKRNQVRPFWRKVGIFRRYQKLFLFFSFRCTIQNNCSFKN